MFSAVLGEMWLGCLMSKLLLHTDMNVFPPPIPRTITNIFCLSDGEAGRDQNSFANSGLLRMTPSSGSHNVNTPEHGFSTYTFRFARAYWQYSYNLYICKINDHIFALWANFGEIPQTQKTYSKNFNSKMQNYRLEKMCNINTAVLFPWQLSTFIINLIPQVNKRDVLMYKPSLLKIRTWSWRISCFCVVCFCFWNKKYQENQQEERTIKI